MKFRLVWPAIVLIAGATILTAFAAIFLGFFFVASFIAMGQSLSFNDVLPYLSIGLSGLVGSFLSIALMLDEAHHRLWGILGLVPSAVASYFLLQWFQFVLREAIGPLSRWLYILASSPLLVLAGAIGGILWRPLAQKRTRTLPS